MNFCCVNNLKNDPSFNARTGERQASALKETTRERSVMLDECACVIECIRVMLGHSEVGETGAINKC